jgi:hypothetical protein
MERQILMENCSLKKDKINQKGAKIKSKTGALGVNFGISFVGGKYHLCRSEGYSFPDQYLDPTGNWMLN